MLRFAPDILWILLLPLSWIYGFIAHFLVMSKKSQKLSIPVISVGNLEWGGTGKTPLVIQLTQEFERFRPAVISRGYRGKASAQGALCDPESKQGPDWYGDEPWMISKKTEAKVYVGARRLQVIKQFFVEKNHGLAILDDGFQHRHIFRNVDILVIPGETNPWEAACIPLGRLREPFSALERASCVVITCASSQDRTVRLWTELLNQRIPLVPVFVAERSLDFEVSKEKALGAFCAIARPERFQTDLTKRGSVQFFQSFSDHHRYKRQDVEKLISNAKELGLTELITTEKDYDKVSKWFEDSAFPLKVAKVKYQFPKELVSFIESKVA